MSTYTRILYQVVFGTKYRKPTLAKQNRKQLFNYMAGIIRAKKCIPYIINGVEDHIHILTTLHPAERLSDLVKDVKVAGSKYIKEQHLFPDFAGWQVGYSAFTYSIDAKENVFRYIQNQETHHQNKSSKEELIDLLVEHGIEYDERFFE